MSADRETYFNKSRINLGEALPLEAPLAITIGVSGVCNLKCKFCSLNDPNNKDKISDIMKFEEFKKIIDDLSLFKTKPKKLAFIGAGEPLTNKSIVEMIRYAKATGYFNAIEMFTNAVLLTPTLTDGLVEAGLTNLVVSLEAIDDETFESIAGVPVNVELLTEQLKYFYQHKQSCNVYIKTMDIALDIPEKIEQFYKVFGAISDNINIENLVDFSDYENQHDESTVKTLVPDKGVQKVCTHIFKNIDIYSNGDVYVCCIGSKEHKLGNSKLDSLYDIWNSERLYQLRIADLTGDKCEFCKKCNPANISPHDNIDDYAEAILTRMIKQHENKE